MDRDRDRLNRDEPGAPSPFAIRALAEDDLAAVVRLDQRLTGRHRQGWYESRLRRALRDTGVNLSLCSEVDGRLVGVLLAEVHYGEFGLAEPVAVLDTVLVDPAMARRGLGRRLLDQLLLNLGALRVDRLRTEVSWAEQPMIQFLAACGFQPAPRLVLEMPVGDR
jgi:GNAT superfamily N-acetyltransferase